MTEPIRRITFVGGGTEPLSPVITFKGDALSTGNFFQTDRTANTR